MRKVGIYYAFWTHEWDVDFIPFAKMVKELGFDILEVNGGTVTAMNSIKRRRLRYEARERGIELSYGIELQKQ
ncbi:MAG TPA: hypothetical protein VMX75_15765 [Spirochaetia bacterium]|nr:hypothetical protein [Spirochaetia bacterium]